MSKLWDKEGRIDEKIERFTIGRDREMDLVLAEWDVLGSLAHVHMLKETGIVTEEEYPGIKEGLSALLTLIRSGKFEIEEHIEDVHSQVEITLMNKIGPAGGKIHTGRSRNDQVLVDLKMYYRYRISTFIELLCALSSTLLDMAEKNKSVLMPGYTHTQVAMTSSFGMWFTGFAEAFYEDALFFDAVFPLINKNPLGSAAGYGSSFPLNRTMTTALLGFEDMHINPINAQYGRGKAEIIMAEALANTALSINKLASDMILYSNENYRFLSLPAGFTTGSSIMPHKKNPDVFELIRAHTNVLMSIPSQVFAQVSNLTTGYHRDFQLLKEILFPAFDKLEEVINLLLYAIPKLEVSEGLLEDPKYAYLFSVDAVNELVKNGMPFRTAYVEIAKRIEKGEFKRPARLDHSHEGSIGNLQIDTIRQKVKVLRQNEKYEKVKAALERLSSS